MRLSLVTPVLLAFGALAAPTDSERKAKPHLVKGKVSFVLVGDSTTNNGTTLNSGGWANGFCGSLEDGTFCSNRASNGKTTGTIVTAGFWDQALNDVRSEVKKGQTVFITLQFGHNDMKIAPPSSMGANLTSFVSQLREIGGHPILITALSRRSFVNGTSQIADTLGPWADETISVAQKTNTPLLDLHAVSLNYLQHIGPQASWLLNRAPTDFTHLNLSGQMLFGRMVADLFQLFAANFPRGPKFLSPFITNPPLSLALLTGTQYVYVPEYPTTVNATTAVSSEVASATVSAA